MTDIVERLRSYMRCIVRTGDQGLSGLADDIEVAADTIAALRERVAELEGALSAIRQSGIDRDAKWAGMNAHDIARSALQGDKE